MGSHGGGERSSNQGRGHASRDSSRSSSVNDQPEPQDEHDTRHEGPLAVSAPPVPQSTAHGSVRPPQARSEPYRPYPQPREEEEQKGDGGSATVTPRQEPMKAWLRTEPAIVGTGGGSEETGGGGGKVTAADDQVNTTQLPKIEADAETASGGGAVTPGYQGDTLRIRIAAPVHYTADDDTFTSVFNTFSDESYKVALAHMPNSELVKIAIEARQGRNAMVPLDPAHYTDERRAKLHEQLFGAWKLTMQSVIKRLSLLGECGAVLSLHTGIWRTRNSHHYHLTVDRHAVLRVAAARRTEQSDDESRFVHLIYHTNSHPEVIVPSTAEAGGSRDGRQEAKGGAGKEEGGGGGPGAGGVPVRLVLVDQAKGFFAIRNAHDGLAMDCLNDGKLIWFPYHGRCEQYFQFEVLPASGFGQQPYWLVPAYVEKQFSVGRIFREFGAEGKEGPKYLAIDDCNNRLIMTKDMERAQQGWSLVPTGSVSPRVQPPVRQRTIRSYGSTELSLPPPPEYNHWNPRPNKYFAQDLERIESIKHSGRPFSLRDLPHGTDYRQLELVPHPFLPILGFRVLLKRSPFNATVSRVMLAMLDIIQSFSLDSHAVITTSRMRAVSQADAAVGPTLLTVPIIEEMEEPKVWSDPCMMGYIIMPSTVFIEHHPGGQEAASSWLRLFTQKGNRHRNT